MERQEISALINEVVEGVNKSQLGPLFQHPDPMDLTNKQVNQMAWAAVTIIMTQLFKNNNIVGR